jgi:hypothetical protein
MVMLSRKAFNSQYSSRVSVYAGSLQRSDFPVYTHINSNITFPKMAKQ